MKRKSKYDEKIKIEGDPEDVVRSLWMENLPKRKKNVHIIKKKKTKDDDVE